MNYEKIDDIKAAVYQMLPFGVSFDLIARDLVIGQTPALLLCVNGFISTDNQEKLLSSLQDIKADSLDGQELAAYLTTKIPFAGVELVSMSNPQHFCTTLLEGPALLCLEGVTSAIAIDVRSYISRSIEEPDSEKISGGAKDGFNESLVTNTSLIRRRIRSRDLVFSLTKIGSHSQTDVVVAYKHSVADQQLLNKIMTDLSHIQADSLTMGAQSLAELLLPKKWWSPLPSFRLTSRPDVACSYLEEGYILLMVDTSPQVIILPCSLFQFTQSPEDYCNAPLVGTYSRWIRFICIPVNLFLLPLFLLLTVYYPKITQELALLSQPLTKTRLIFYTFAAEFLLDLLKHSTEQSDSRRAGTLSIIGGLIIGDMAINMHWVSPEILFYAGFTLLTSLSLPSAEFADALRTYRVILLVLTAAFGLPGFIAAIVITLLSIATTPVYGPYSYLWPLIPFHWKALKSLLMRYPTVKKQPPKRSGDRTRSG